MPMFVSHMADFSFCITPHFGTIKMATLVRCIFGPRLYKRYRDPRGDPRDEGLKYAPNFIESTGDKFIQVMNFCWSLSYWTSPVLLTVLYRRNYFSMEGAVSLLKFLLSLGILYSTSFLVRGIGRFSNGEYVTFISCLYSARKSLSADTRRRLSLYDFEFKAWIPDYDVRTQQGRSRRHSVKKLEGFPYDSTVASFPLNVLCYLAIHSFGRRMIYPGATALMNMLLSTALLEGRTRFIEEKNGVRAKVITEDGNEIDTMFVDRRGTKNTNGNYLVLCCDGNAGYYEIGNTCTPLEAGYSVLGWNHPGFGGSSGQPYPNTEQSAVDAVMQYAINKLGFMPSSIVLFAWSIGGYSAAWAAKEYPDVKFVVMDATFDDLVPLAVSKMPASWQGLVTRAVRKYMNLNIADQLACYPGPISIIRRSKDEIITTESPPGMPPVLASNRGNNLLIQLLQYRYPKLVDQTTLPVLVEWLMREKPMQELLWMEHQVNTSWCEATLQSYSEQHSTYPWQLGVSLTQAEKSRLTLYLASRYMKDFDSTHCTPLPPSMFTVPWSVSS